MSIPPPTELGVSKDCHFRNIKMYKNGKVNLLIYFSFWNTLPAVFIPNCIPNELIFVAQQRAVS